MTEEADIFSLLRIILARKPSEQAVQDLMKVPVRQTLLRMLVSDEFADNILNGMLRDKALPHEAKSIPFTNNDLVWIRGNIPLSDDSLARLDGLSDWYELFLILLSDRALDDALTMSYNQTARLARMRKRGAAVLAAGRPKPVVRPKPPEKSKPKPAPPPAPVAAKPTKAKAAEPVTPAAKTPKVEPVAAPVVVKEAYEVGSGRKLLDDIRDGLDYGATRNGLHELFKRGAIEILWLHSQAETAGVPAEIAYLIRYIAVRAYMRQEMFETAFTLSNELLQQEILFQGLLPVDKARLSKMYALAALRSGRADRAIALYREMLVRYPEDWEVYYQLADNLGAADLQDAVRYFQYALRFAGRIPP
ncbi:MAG TPA: tetratricopeptide repeat protein, partial [Asticcacaulis sp.]|nr:tetratricopeptide repeat protein [Asticcacaulis sp.]